MGKILKETVFFEKSRRGFIRFCKVKLNPQFILKNGSDQLFVYGGIDR